MAIYAHQLILDFLLFSLFFLSIYSQICSEQFTILDWFASTGIISALDDISQANMLETTTLHPCSLMTPSSPYATSRFCFMPCLFSEKDVSSPLVLMEGLVLYSKPRRSLCSFPHPSTATYIQSFRIWATGDDIFWPYRVPLNWPLCLVVWGSRYIPHATGESARPISSALAFAWLV